VWQVDESGEQEDPDKPGLLLVQADGRHDLEDPDDWNQGDAGDPFPGSARRTRLGEAGRISTSFPGSVRSGVTLANIRRDPATSVITLDVKIAAVAGASRSRASQGRR
jgi:immune inhibitor A